MNMIIFFAIHRKLAPALLSVFSAMLIDTELFATATSTRYNRNARKLGFFVSLTDDRHNPNLNPRNSTNPPALPLFTLKPTSKPSKRPTHRPTRKPSARPSRKPTNKPSSKPSAKPSIKPSGRPSAKPSMKPSGRPSTKPSMMPSGRPSAKPSVKPSGRPSAKPSMIPSGWPSAKPSLKPTGRPSAKPSIKPSGRPSAKPSVKPSGQPSVKPSAWPFTKPTTEPSARPSAKPTAIISKRPSLRVPPSTKPASLPSARPTGKPSSLATIRPTLKPSKRPTPYPTVSPTTRPSAKRTFRPTAQPSTKPSVSPTPQPTIKLSAIPTPSPTINYCARKHYGSFGNTSSNNYIFVPYHYEMVTSDSIVSDQNKTISDVVQAVEDAITDMLLKNFFRNCALYFGQNRSRWLVMQRALAFDQVDGISSQPNDIVVGDNCDVSSAVPSNKNIFSPSSLSCSILQGRLTVYVADGLMDDSAVLELLFNSARTLIKNGMNHGELALANDAILVLRYKEDSEKDLATLAPILTVIAPSHSSNQSVQWSLIGLAILAVLLALLAARRRFKRKKVTKVFRTLDDEKARTDNIYDFEGLPDFSLTLPSYESSSLLLDKMNDAPRSQTKNGHVVNIDAPKHHKKLVNSQASVLPESYRLKQQRNINSFDIEGIDEFMEYRFLNHDDLSLQDITPLCSMSDVINDSSESLSVDDSNLSSENGEHAYTYDGIGLDRGAVTKYSMASCSTRDVINASSESPSDNDKNISPLNHVCVSSLNTFPFENGEEAYTYEGMGTNRGTIPKCSICFKNADGWMRRCNCGNLACDKIAHSTCIYGKNPTPSISYPGTPPAVLPPILCGSEIRGLRRSRSYDELSPVVSGVSKPLRSDFDDCSYADDKMNVGIIGFLECR